jgi:hypothetical protein
MFLDIIHQVLPEDGDRIQSPRRCVLKNKEDGVLDQDKTMANVQEHNICTNVPSSQTLRSYSHTRDYKDFCFVGYSAV